jgi:hypothetical protein
VVKKVKVRETMAKGQIYTEFGTYEIPLFSVHKKERKGGFWDYLRDHMEDLYSLLFLTVTMFAVLVFAFSTKNRHVYDIALYTGTISAVIHCFLFGVRLWKYKNRKPEISEDDEMSSLA